MVDPVVNSPSAGRIAWNQGLRFGIIIAAISVIISIIVSFVHGVGLLSLLSDLIVIVGFVLAGMYASRLTGRVGTGAMAGLYAGLIAGIVFFIVGLILFFTLTIHTASTAVQQVSGQSVSNSVLIAGGIGSAVIGLIFDIGLGAGLGAIGGLFGRNQYQVQAPLHQDALYQEGAPVAGTTDPVAGVAEPVVQTPPANESYEPTEQDAGETIPTSTDPSSDNPV